MGPHVKNVHEMTAHQMCVYEMTDHQMSVHDIRPHEMRPQEISALKREPYILPWQNPQLLSIPALEPYSLVAGHQETFFTIQSPG
jgi:hypothetical protein